MDWYELTDIQIQASLGNRLRLARMMQKLTQQMVADKSGVNRTTIRAIENGKSDNLISIIAMLRGLNLLHKLEDILPSMEESPVLMHTFSTKKRVRLSKNH
jgi:DNA-binding XRE family transcriptional regulator